jgi:hypothetical protein
VGTPPGTLPGGTQQALVPEYCLVRFLDVTIEPGKTYEYHFKIRMHNPNHKRTDVAYPDIAVPEDLVSPDWIPVPGRVTAPSETSYYVVDQKDLDKKSGMKDFNKVWANTSAPKPGQVLFQAQRWADVVYPDPTSRKLSYAVADWIVAERYPVYRGEYVAGPPTKTEVPTWNYLEDKFVLATAGGKSKERTIPVVFGDETVENNPLLLDFEGGEVTHNRVVSGGGEDEKVRTTTIKDKAPVEAILLTPEGKLLVRDGETDAQDQTRRDHLKAWKDRVSELKPKQEPSGKPGERANPFDTKPEDPKP